MRRTAFRLLLTGLCASWLAISPDNAAAQVAVSPLAPIAPIVNGNPGRISAGFVLLNPAAQQWGAPSRVGIGFLDGETDVLKQGTYDYDGRLAGMRLVGMRFSLALEQLEIDGIDTAALQNLTFKQSNAALSMRLFDPLSLGVGYGKQSYQSGTASQTVTTGTLGGSLRIGEWLYLGVAGGEDTRDYEDSSLPYSATDDRNFSLYGIGLRSGGTFSYHVEWFGSDMEAYNLGDTKTRKLTSGTGVLEIGLWNFVLGGRVAQVEEDREGSNYKTEARIYDFAWAPFRGLTIGARYEVTQEMDEGTGTESENEIRGITVGWQF